MQERWAKIEGAPDYEVSDLGRVRRATAGAGTYPGRILALHANRLGYWRVGLTLNGKRRTADVHRLVANAFLGKPPTEKHIAAHWDGNASNSAVTNLRWATHKENTADRVRHGTDNWGARYPGRKVGDAVIGAIRASTKSYRAIAAEYGVSAATVSDVKNGKRWAAI